MSDVSKNTHGQTSPETSLDPTRNSVSGAVGNMHTRSETRNDASNIGFAQDPFKVYQPVQIGQEVEGTSNWSDNDTPLVGGVAPAVINVGIGFDSVVAAVAGVTAATLTLDVEVNQLTGATFEARAQDTVAAAAFAATAGDFPSDMTSTTAFVNAVDVRNVNGLVDIDVTDIVNELAATASWSPTGERINFILLDEAATDGVSLIRSAKLTIEE
jgi:hypothetical protein